MISRKWILTVAILAISSVMCFIPPLIAAIWLKSSLVVMPAELWVVTISIITGSYNLANVYQKKIEAIANNVLPNPEDKKEP